jgi:hypothetical protein
MKRRLLLLLLLFFLLADGFGSLFRPQLPSRTAAVRPPEDCGLQSAGERAFSFLVRQLASADWLRPIEPPELVPQDALLMLDLADDAATAVKAFAASPLGTALTSADWSAALAQLGMQAGRRQLLAENAAALSSLLAHPLSKELFSRRAVLALLNPASPPQASSSQFWLEQLLLIVRPGPADSPAALLALLQPERQQTVWHQGLAVHVLALKENRTVYAASVGSQLALSFALRPVEESIDLFLRHLVCKQTGLPLNPDYAAVKASAQGRDDFFLHADLARIASLFSLPAPALPSLGLFHQQDGQTDRFTAAARFPPAPPPLPWAGTPPAANRSLAKLPAGLLIYFWSNWLPPGFWLQAVPAQEDELAAADAWLRQKGGLGLADVPALFGREFSFSVAEISTAGLLPVPRICLMLAVPDQRKAERLLERMISGLPVRREAAAGVPVVSLLAANGLMQPSYAFADGLLLLADSREQLTDILANRAERIVQSPVFQAVDTGLGQPANLGLFVRPAQLADGLKALAAWAGTMIAARDKAAGAKSRHLIEQVILPLLDGMKMFEAVGLRSAVRPDGLVVEAAVLRAGK